MNFRSNTKADIRCALEVGTPCYIFDSGNDGEDDVLIDVGHEGPEALLREVASFHEKEEVPVHWTMTPLAPGEIV